MNGNLSLNYCYFIIVLNMCTLKNFIFFLTGLGPSGKNGNWKSHFFDPEKAKKYLL